MHRAHSGSFRVRIEARHEWVEPEDFPEADLRPATHPLSSKHTVCVKRKMGPARAPHVKDKMACGSKEFDPPFPFPPRGTPGRAGSPHAAAGAAAPPARGVSKRSAETPLAPSPRLATPIRCPRESVRGRGRRKGEIIKDGHHVGLDFYDLLIEADNGNYRGGERAKQSQANRVECTMGSTEVPIGRPLSR